MSCVYGKEKHSLTKKVGWIFEMGGKGKGVSNGREQGFSKCHLILTH